MEAEDVADIREIALRNSFNPDTEVDPGSAGILPAKLPVCSDS